MVRTRKPDPFSSDDLRSKHGVCAAILWQRRYGADMLKEFPAMFSPSATTPCSATTNASIEGAKAMLFSPMVLYHRLQGPDRDPTWMNALPTEPLRMFYKHWLEVGSLMYQPEIKGAIAKTGINKWTWQNFFECDRPKKRFAEAFRLSYSKIDGKESSGEQTEETRIKEGEEEKEEGIATQDKQLGQTSNTVEKSSKLSAFRKDVEKSVEDTLAERVVVLTLDGEHPELQNAVTGCRLYKNLSAVGARLMGFYDVKNASLCDISTGESLLQKEPVLDVEHLQAFLSVMNGVMKDNCDVCWIMCGKVGCSSSSSSSSTCLLTL
jgi:hypothetical protein